MKIILTVLGLALLAWGVCFWQKSTAPAALAKKWHDQVFGLDEGEVARFVPQPYSRIADFGRASGIGSPSSLTSWVTVDDVNATWWMHWGMSLGPQTVLSAITFCTGLSERDLDFRPNLAGLRMDGDWIIRNSVSIDARMKALNSVINSAAKEDLQFEKRMVQRDLILARGKWAFKKAEGARHDLENSVHFYTGKLDPNESGGMRGEFISLMRELEKIGQRKVIDEVSDRPRGYVDVTNHRSQQQAAQSEAALAELLENLTKQTGLEFIRIRRVMPIWFIEDNAATTRQAGGP